MQLAQKYQRLFVRCPLVATVSIVSVLSGFTGTALASPGVAIPDDNLRAALKQELGKGQGDPHCRS